MLALAAVACGPASHMTLAANAQERIYVANDRAVGCQRDHPRGLDMGSVWHILGVRLAGHFAAVTRPSAHGQTYRVYDLRRGRAERSSEVAGAFVALRLDRTGLAAYVAASPDGTRTVDTVPRSLREPGRASIDPKSLRLAGGTLAWSMGATVELRHVRPSRDAETPLLALGSVRFSVTRGSLGVRSGGGRLRRLGRAIDAFGLAGAHLATRERGRVSLRTLPDGAGRTVCGPEAAIPSFVVTETGGVACATVTRAVRRIRTARAVLDEGEGIDPESLQRRGDRIVWRHDGVERSASLP